MYSLVIKIAIEVNRAVELDMIMPAIGLKNASVLEVIVEADPNKTSIVNIITFFLLKLFYFLL